MAIRGKLKTNRKREREKETEKKGKEKKNKYAMTTKLQMNTRIFE